MNDIMRDIIANFYSFNDKTARFYFIKALDKPLQDMMLESNDQNIIKIILSLQK